MFASISSFLVISAGNAGRQIHGSLGSSLHSFQSLSLVTRVEGHKIWPMVYLFRIAVYIFDNLYPFRISSPSEKLLEVQSFYQLLGRTLILQNKRSFEKGSCIHQYAAIG
ncbi:hypothetical protein Droror1_Dr00007922 [Drosera rotundifolia]